MEQILAFVLGVSAVTFVWVVVVAFKTSKKVKEIEDTLQGVFHELHRNDEMVNRRIDQEIDRTDQLYTECNKYINSRVDKLDAKFSPKGVKEILKG